MYPIRIFGIRVPPDIVFEYALYDDTAHYDARESVTCFSSPEDMAAFVARVLFETNRETALLCVRQPEHLHNLFAFSARPLFLDSNGVFIRETRLLTADERVAFLESLYTELCSVKSEKNK